MNTLLRAQLRAQESKGNPGAGGRGAEMETELKPGLVAREVML